MSVHCVPIADERAHDLSADCWCDGRVEWLDPETNLPWAAGSYRMIHNAADFRELAEGDGTSMAPGKGWEVVESEA